MIVSRRCGLWCVTAVLAITSASIDAREMCEPSRFLGPDGASHIRRLEAADKLYFHRGTLGCPEDERCRTTAYIVKGDEVLVGEQHGNWACTLFIGTKQNTAGWLPLDRLVAVTDPASLEWTGRWRRAEGETRIDAQQFAEISIAADKDALTVTGQSQAVRGQFGYTGEMQGALRRSGDSAKLLGENPEYSCFADFRRVGKYLLVKENGNCSGIYAKFDGIYLRQ